MALSELVKVQNAIFINLGNVTYVTTGSRIQSVAGMYLEE